MPSRNIIKDYGADQYYHVYSRGVNKQPIFLDDKDYRYFLGLFKRYLSPNPTPRKKHSPYPHFGQRIQLLAYCLMRNHIHILLYQSDATAMTEYLRATMTSYSKYFNEKYDRVGPVFQSRYKASRITTPMYLEHISRYIHLNPSEWKTYPYSSLPYYMQKQSAEWLHPEFILGIFGGPKKYATFVKDYEGQRQILDELKWELANNP